MSLISRISYLGILAALAGMAVTPAFPGQCVTVAPATVEAAPGSLIGREVLRCASGLNGGKITLTGLDRTVLDALVRIEFADGRETTVRAGVVLNCTGVWTDQLQASSPVGVAIRESVIGIQPSPGCTPLEAPSQFSQ